MKAMRLRTLSFEGALEGMPVTETITVLQRLGAHVSRSSAEHRANTGIRVLPKIVGFGPVVATVSNGSEKYATADIRIVPKCDWKILMLQVAQKHREKMMI